LASTLKWTTSPDVCCPPFTWSSFASRVRMRPNRTAAVSRLRTVIGGTAAAADQLFFASRCTTNQSAPLGPALGGEGLKRGARGDATARVPGPIPRGGGVRDRAGSPDATRFPCGGGVGAAATRDALARTGEVAQGTPSRLPRPPPRMPHPGAARRAGRGYDELPAETLARFEDAHAGRVDPGAPRAALAASVLALVQEGAQARLPHAPGISERLAELR
jgi:hypothetical protein